MKKNYKLKVILAMLIVLLVSLVSFVGVYKGKSLLKDYSFGKDFKERKVASFSVVEETTEETAEESTEEATEESQNEGESTEESSDSQSTEKNSEEVPEENKSEQYKTAKNILEKRLTAMKAEDFEIRLDEKTGSLAMEVPTDMDNSYLSEIIAEGKIKVINQSTNETIIESNGFKSASARIDSTTYSVPIITLTIKFTNEAKNTFKNINTNYTDSEGNESEATFAFTVDGETLYSDTAQNFANSAKNGALDLVLGQGDEGEQLEDDYQSALVLVSIINNGEISTKYQLDSVKIVSSSINIKSIIIISCIIGALMLIYAIFKFKSKGILPVISLVGLLATILLVLRYTNVTITLLTILGLAVIVIANYILILRTLGNNKTFKQNFIEMLNILIPCFIIAIVFCCSPYLQVASMGMTIFWGAIVMFIYDVVITRILINK